MPVLTPAPLIMQGVISIILQATCALATLNNPNHLGYRGYYTARNDISVGIASPCQYISAATLEASWR